MGWKSYREVTFEWDVETVDEYGDITHDHYDRLRHAPKPDELEDGQRLVLVRDVWEYGDQVDRDWCYIQESFEFVDSAGVLVGGRTPGYLEEEFRAWKNGSLKPSKTEEKSDGN